MSVLRELDDSSATSNGESETGNNFHLVILSLFAFLAALCIFFNTKVVYAVFRDVHVGKTRPALILVAHLAVVSACLGLTSLFQTEQQVYLVEPPKSLCKIISYLKNSLSSAISLNVALIVYYRLISYEKYRHKLGPLAWIVIIWLVALLFNLPQLGMVKSKVGPSHYIDINSGNCDSANLMESLAATVLHEGLKFALFSGSTSVFMIYARRKIRSRLNYLRDHSVNHKIWPKFISIRRMRLHVVCVVIFFLTTGLYQFCNNLFHRLHFISVPFSGKHWQILGIILSLIINLLEFLFLTFNPIVTMLLLEDKMTFSMSCFLRISCQTDECKYGCECCKINKSISIQGIQNADNGTSCQVVTMASTSTNTFFEELLQHIYEENNSTEKSIEEGDKVILERADNKEKENVKLNLTRQKALYRKTKQVQVLTEYEMIKGYEVGKDWKILKEYKVLDDYKVLKETFI